MDVFKVLEVCDFLVGYGEVVKYGLLGDVDFFEWLEENGLKLVLGDEVVWIYVVKCFCEMKVEIVMCDEIE